MPFSTIFRAETWSIAADFSNFKDPFGEPSDAQKRHQDPELFDRILGSVLFSLSMLVIIPACLFLYWAGKKVEKIDSCDLEKGEKKTNEIAKGLGTGDFPAQQQVPKETPVANPIAGTLPLPQKIPPQPPKDANENAKPPTLKPTKIRGSTKSRQWKDVHLSPTEAEKHALRNSFRALKNHRRPDLERMAKELEKTSESNPEEGEKQLLAKFKREIPVDKSDYEVFATEQEFLSAYGQKPVTLSFQIGDHESIGYRPTMEDAHFTSETNDYLLAGVFDGHGGAVVAQKAKELFKNNFAKYLQENQGNVHATFETLIGKIDYLIQLTGEKENVALKTQGSTAVITYVDKKTNKIYTATLGDAEANIYRSYEGTLKSIPLSPVLDWSYEKEAQRLAELYGKEKAPPPGRRRHTLHNIYGNVYKSDQFPTNPKELRDNPKHNRANVSRAFGDYSKSPRPQLTKPKITVNQLQKGDLLILCCDGLKDAGPEKQIIEKINNWKQYELPKAEDNRETLAQWLVEYGERSRDNVTVITINVS